MGVRTPFVVSPRGAFDTLEQLDADDQQAGGKHHAKQRVGDHNGPNRAHQRSKRLDLGEQHGDASGSRFFDDLLLSKELWLRGPDSNRRSPG